MTNHHDMTEQAKESAKGLQRAIGAADALHSALENLTTCSSAGRLGPADGLTRGQIADVERMIEAVEPIIRRLDAMLACVADAAREPKR